MPIYEYRCPLCHHEFEKWQKMSDPPVRMCPTCKRRRVTRLVSAAAFHLKGGGWYRDGYSSSKAAKSTESANSNQAAKPAESTNSKSNDVKSSSQAGQDQAVSKRTSQRATG